MGLLPAAPPPPVQKRDAQHMFLQHGGAHAEKLKDEYRRRTNVQQLTCNIDLSSSFYYLFFSFVLIEPKPFVLKGKVLGEQVWKSAKKCEKV